VSRAAVILGRGLAVRRLRVADRDTVYLRSVLEAYDGLTCFYGDGSGTVTLTTPEGRAHELDGLLEDLRREGLVLVDGAG